MIRQQRGAGMIEILVAVLIFAIGLLGVGGMQIFALKMNTNADIRTRANLLATDMVERMRANPSQWDEYPMTSTQCSSAVSASPSSTDIAAMDRSLWCQKLERELPEGKGAVEMSSGVVTITLNWQEREGRETTDADGNGTGSELAEHEFILRARLTNA